MPWLYEVIWDLRLLRAYDDFHKMLVSLLPVRGILTTNYDTVLEAALLAR